MENAGQRMTDMKKRVFPFLLGLAGMAGVVAAFATGTSDEADDAVVLGEEDLAERAEILRNQFRRMTPGDVPLVQDIGTWPAAWEEFSQAWDSAPATRDLATWLVPVEVALDGADTVLLDGNGAELWRGETDFSKEESSSVTLTGWLVDEDDWPLYEAARAALSRRLTSQTPRLRDGEGGGASNELTGLRFVSVAADFTNTPPEFRVGLAWTNSGTLDVFAYGPLHVAETNAVTYTNDENVVVNTNVVTWHSVEPSLSGFDNDWTWVGTLVVTNSETNVFVDTSFTEDRAKVRFYAAAPAVDSDSDGLNDGFEIFVSHSALDSQDGDEDGLSDYDEYWTYHTNPLDADTDHDGIDDSTEITRGLDPNDPDTDHDGLKDGEEDLIGTDPFDPDSDNDGLLDGWEIENGLNPLNASGDNGADGDLDGDGFSNILEFELGAPANNAAWTGEELAWKLTHFSCTVTTNARSVSTNWHGMRVDIEDSVDCGGANNQTQNKTVELSVTNLVTCGYYIELTVEGIVEDVDAEYDIVSLETPATNELFSSHDGITGDAQEYCLMTNASATGTFLIMDGTTVTLRYNTVGHRWHCGAYAEITSATCVSNYNVEVGVTKFIPVGGTVTAIAFGGSGEPYTWSKDGDAIEIDSVTGEITAIEPGEACVIATDSSGDCFGIEIIVVFDVGLTVGKNLLTLKHDRECDLAVHVTPEDYVPVEAYRIDIRQTNSSIWRFLCHTNALNPWCAHVAGSFYLRGAAKIAGQWFYSSNRFVQVQFPEYSQIANDPVVQSITDAAWSDTLSDCTATPLNRRRERGFWILLDTGKNSYTNSSVETGSWTGPGNDAGIYLSSRPLNFPRDPWANASNVVYAVASFHTHTPVEYRTAPPGITNWSVGSSTNDNAVDLSEGVPGIVYDYISSPTGSGTIPLGHPENSPAKRYQSLGTIRRIDP